MHNSPNLLHDSPILPPGCLARDYSCNMGTLERNRCRMVKLLEAIDAPEGVHASALDEVLLPRTSRSTAPTPVLYERCGVVVTSGCKFFHLPDLTVRYDARNFLMLTTPVPADCQTVAGKGEPFLAIAVRIDLNTLSELILAMTSLNGVERPVPARLEGDPRVHTPSMNAAIGQATRRLRECLRAPSEARILGPQRIREFLYRVLSSEGGDALRDLLLGDENRREVHRVMEHMHLHPAEPLQVTRLAKKVGMSESALYQHFKAVTGTSPVQYLKSLRLYKARQMMVHSLLPAAIAAERVGYSSPSQFSRDFRRTFGAPPAREAQRVRSAFGYEG